MLDFFLLLAVAFLQGVLGYMGFRVSVTPDLTPAQRKDYLRAFVGMSVLGIFLVVLTGYRSSEVTSEILELLQPAPSKLVVWNVAPRLPTDTDGFHFDIFIANVGRNIAVSNVPLFDLKSATGVLPPNIEDRVFADFAGKLPAPHLDPESTNQIQPGDDGTLISKPDDYESPERITADKLNGWIKRGPIYLFGRIAWIDAKSKKIWISEFCEYWVPNSAMHRCYGHNRVFLRDGP